MITYCFGIYSPLTYDRYIIHSPLLKQKKEHLGKENFHDQRNGKHKGITNGRDAIFSDVRRIVQNRGLIGDEAQQKRVGDAYNFISHP